MKPNRLGIDPATIEALRSAIEAKAGPVDVVVIVTPKSEAPDGKQWLGRPLILSSLSDRDLMGFLAALGAEASAKLNTGQTVN